MMLPLRKNKGSADQSRRLRLALVERRPMSLARRKLEQRRRRVLPSLLALLANQSPNEIVHACRPARGATHTDQRRGASYMSLTLFVTLTRAREDHQNCSSRIFF
jgi:hypothetical protein